MRSFWFSTINTCSYARGDGIYCFLEAVRNQTQHTVRVFVDHDGLCELDESARERYAEYTRLHNISIIFSFFPFVILIAGTYARLTAPYV